MSRDPKSFMRQFEKAKKEIAELKRVVPHLFPDWAELKSAQREFEKAKLRLERAQQRWEGA